MSQCEQNHDEAHFWTLAEIYEEYDGFIQSVIRFAAKNRADQEDVYQEVFVVLSQMGNFDKIRDIKSYLYRLIVNKANEFLRKKISGELKLKKYMQLHGHQTEEGEQKQDLLIQDEVDKAIGLIREYLSDKESEAVLLRYKYHYSDEEAAHKMNVRKKTLIRYVSIGLKKIREIVKGKERADE